MDKNFPYERYQRQTLLKEFGEEGQQKLLNASVLVIGAGGLGCPALQYLAAAGVGSIGIADHDIVELSNLHRQPLFTSEDLGLFKADLAAERLKKINPGISIYAYREYLDVSNTLEILNKFDIILDGTDNFATRYLINDACVLLGKPLVYGAISQYQGQVAIFNNSSAASEAGPVNYRDLFPQPPVDGEVPNCAEAGVLGVLPGIIGTMMASETIKLITGIGQPLISCMLSFNALSNQYYVFQITPRAGTRSLIPPNEKAFRNMDYAGLCASSAIVTEIDLAEFDQMLKTGQADLIDVRGENELPAIDEFSHLRIPLHDLEDAIPELKYDTVIVFCQTGKRSRTAVSLLSKKFGGSKKIYSLKGGIAAWKKLYMENTQ